MRSKLPLVLLLAIAGIFGLFSLWDSHDSGLQGMQSGLSSDAEASGTQTLAGIQAEERVAESSLAPPEEKQEEAAEPQGSDLSGPCVVIGIVEDERFEPMSGVRVRLYGYRGWAEGVDVPKLAHRWDVRGFETWTDDKGQFRFAVPIPTVKRTVAALARDRFHDSHDIRFNDGNNGRSLPRLKGGVRDLGVIRLEDTGAVTGRVLDSFGSPLEGAKVNVGPSISSTFSRSDRTGADGSFMIGHAPVGTYGICALVDGFLQEFQEPVEVVAGQVTSGIEFRLKVSPTIEGWVVDPDGNGIEGAKVGGWPLRAGRYAKAISDVNGYFRIELPQDEALSLMAEREGYSTWGDEHDQSNPYEPRTRDLRITLEPMEKTRFVVLDAATGKPVLEYGISIKGGEGSKAKTMSYSSRNRPPVKDRPGGVSSVGCMEGVDLYVIGAPGFRLATGDVKWDEPGVALQTVRLESGGQLFGRVLRDGKPLVGAMVRAEVGRIRIPYNVRGSERGAGVKSFVLGQSTVKAETDQAGVFRMEGLEKGQHRVTITPDTGAPSILYVTLAEDDSSQDLGDILMLEGASASGQVLLPAGMRVPDLVVTAGDPRRGRKTLLDKEGRFAFQDLAPGLTLFTLSGKENVLEESVPVEVELLPGETAQVTLDARDRAMCHVSLTIEIAGQSVEGMWVQLIDESDREVSKGLGRCDANGHAEGFVRAWGTALVSVRGKGMTFEQGEDPLALVAGGRIERTLRFETSSMVIRLPEGVSFPELGSARVLLKYSDRSVDDLTIQCPIRGGDLKKASSALAQLTPRQISLQGLPVGSFEVSLELNRSRFVDESQMTRTGEFVRYTQKAGDTQMLGDEPPYFSLNERVLLSADTEQVVE